MSARARCKPAADTNVVPLRASTEAVDDIIRSVEERQRQQGARICALLDSATAALRQRHRERVQECLPIGYAMDGQKLADWLEIGRRMAGMGVER